MAINAEQLEALIRLAAALESCEENGLNLSPGDGVVELFYGERGVWIDLPSMKSSSIQEEIRHWGSSKC